MANLQVGVAGNGTITVGAGASVHSPASNTLTLGTNGDERLRIDSSGNTLVNVNTATAGSYTYKLLSSDNISSSEQTLGIQYPSVVTYGLNAESNADFTIKKDGTERLRILSNGRIGVGTESSSSALQIYASDEGEGTAKGQITLKDTAAYNAAPQSGIVFQGHHASNNAQAIWSGIRGFKANAADGDYDGCLAFDVRKHGAIAYEAMRINEDGNVGIGTDNPQVKLTVSSTSPAVCDIHHIDGGTNDEARIILGALAANPPSNRGAGIAAVNNGAGHDLIIKCSASHSAGPTEKLRVTSAGYVGVGEASPATILHVKANVGDMLRLDRNNTGAVGNQIAFRHSASGTLTETASINCVSEANAASGELRFYTKASGGSNAEKVRFTNGGQGQIIVGSSVPGTSTTIDSESAMIQCNRRENGRGGILHGISWGGGGPRITLAKSGSTTVGTAGVVSNGDGLGTIIFAGDDGTDFARAVLLMGLVNAAPGNDDMAGEFRIYTTADGTHSPVQRYSVNCRGIHQMDCHSGGEEALTVNRQVADGTLIGLEQAGTQEGNIAVSGSTVSYNGGHLSRWSKIAGISETDKSARPTIYQGTVMSNLDELCVWSHPATDAVLYTQQDADNGLIPDDKNVGDVNIPARDAWTEDNQQLNKTKVSTVDGDKDVAGVFWAWDDADDEYVNDYYIAMTGDMVIRVAGSTTVARGDLLISAGDGTAKPQADDIVRSSTIAKIISTNSTATYADGSKAYPCVLMAC